MFNADELNLFLSEESEPSEKKLLEFAIPWDVAEETDAGKSRKADFIDAFEISDERKTRLNTKLEQYSKIVDAELNDLYERLSILFDNYSIEDLESKTKLDNIIVEIYQSQKEEINYFFIRKKLIDDLKYIVSNKNNAAAEDIVKVLSDRKVTHEQEYIDSMVEHLKIHANSVIDTKKHENEVINNTLTEIRGKLKIYQNGLDVEIVKLSGAKLDQFKKGDKNFKYQITKTELKDNIPKEKRRAIAALIDKHNLVSNLMDYTQDGVKTPQERLAKFKKEFKKPKTKERLTSHRDKSGKGLFSDINNKLNELVVKIRGTKGKRVHDEISTFLDEPSPKPKRRRFFW